MSAKDEFEKWLHIAYPLTASPSPWMFREGQMLEAFLAGRRAGMTEAALLASTCGTHVANVIFRARDQEPKP